MNWEHPAEVMRWRILGKHPSCIGCRFNDEGQRQDGGTWCKYQTMDPARHLSGTQYQEGHPEQVCERWHPPES